MTYSLCLWEHTVSAQTKVVTRRHNDAFEPITPTMNAEQQATANTFYKLKLTPKAIKLADGIHPSAIPLHVK